MLFQQLASSRTASLVSACLEEEQLVQTSITNYQTRVFLTKRQDIDYTETTTPLFLWLDFQLLFFILHSIREIVECLKTSFLMWTGSGKEASPLSMISILASRSSYQS